MKIEGQFEFGGVAPDAVWSFLTDATRIAQCLPGCQKLEQTGDGAYDLQMRFGVGAISGIFSGSILLHSLQPTSEYQMTVAGKGSPGFVKGAGTAQVRRVRRARRKKTATRWFAAGGWGKAD